MREGVDRASQSKGKRVITTVQCCLADSTAALLPSLVFSWGEGVDWS